MKRYLFYVEHDYCYAVLRPLQAEIRARGDEAAWLPVGEEFHTQYFREDEKVFTHVREAVDWNPFAVLVPGNHVPGFIPGWKIEVFHGLNSGKRQRNGVEYHFIVRGLFDLYCTHGPNTTTRFRELSDQLGHFSVAETGWSKLDPLFDGSLAAVPSDRPRILFASTFTPRLSAAPHVLDTVVQMAERGHWTWQVNLHPKMPREIVERYRAAQCANLELVETDNVMPLLARADAMLCDTSSILSEFLMQHKPAVTFRAERPLDCVIDVQQLDEIEPALNKALQRPDTLMHSIHRYAKATHPYRDGQSSSRTLDAIDMLDQVTGKRLKRKPLNLLRHWKMRRQLAY